MGDTSKGFRYRGRLYGDSDKPTIQNLIAKDTATYHKGDLLSLDGVTGEVTLATTNSKLIVGLCMETKACVDSTTPVAVLTDADAIYGVYDASARHMNAPLDIAGATGAMTVAADSNHDILVVAESAATEETLVMIMHGAHPLNVTTT